MQLKTKRNYIISMIFFSFCFSFIAQSQNIIISGKVLDSFNNQPLPCATIYSKLQKKGSVTDINGNFKLGIKKNTDTLIISFLGYSNLNVAVNSLSSFSKNTFYLTQKDISISEIVVNPVYPTDIIELALSKIPVNYPDYEMYFTSFFYEKITEDDSIIQQVEAFLDIQKSPYNISTKDKIKFTYGKINKNVKKSKLWDYVFFINGPYELLSSDIVKNPNDFLQVPDNKVDFINGNYFKHYIYSYKDTVDESIIKIIFKPNPETSRGVYKGEIIIDRNSLAFISFDFAYAEERLEKVYYTESSMEIQFRQNGIFMPDNYYKCKVEYERLNDFWILKNVVNEYGFIFQQGKNQPSQIKIVDKLFISEFTTESKKIGFFQQLAKNINILELIPKTDSLLWNSLNIDFE